MCRQDGLRIGLIRGLKALGHLVCDLGQYERARTLYEEAVELSREEGDALLIAHTVRHLGDLYREAGRAADADQCYQEALSRYRNASDPPVLDVANAHRSAATLRETEGDIQVARQLWSEALRGYKAANVQSGIRECEGRLSSLRQSD